MMFAPLPLRFIHFPKFLLNQFCQSWGEFCGYRRKMQAYLRDVDGPGFGEDRGHLWPAWPAFAVIQYGNHGLTSLVPCNDSAITLVRRKQLKSDYPVLLQPGNEVGVVI